MTISTTVTLGDVITLAFFIVGGLGAYLRIRLDMHEIKVKTETMWNAFMHARRLIIEQDGEREGSA